MNCGILRQGGRLGIIAVLFLMGALCRGQSDIDCSSGYLDDGCTLSNISQIAAAFDESGLGYPLLNPCEPTSFNPTQWWYCDFTAVTNSLAAVTNYPGQTMYGITAWPLRVTRNMLTDELTVQYPPLSTNLLQLTLADDSKASSMYSNVLSTWCLLFGRPALSYNDLITQGLTNISPARLVLDVLLINIDEVATLESNSAPPAASSDDGAAFTAGHFGMLTMDDEGPCTVTGAPLSIVSISQDTNLWTTITWAPTCSYDGFVYGVFSTGALSNNTQWQGQCGLWGSDGETSWTDTNSANFTQYYYKIAQMPANGDFSGGGLPNWWALQHGLNPLDLNVAAEDPDNDFWSNLGEYLNGTDPNNSNSLATYSFTLNGGVAVVSNAQVQLGFPVGLVADSVIISESITMSNSVTNSFTSPLSYTLLNTNDGLHMLYLQLLKTSGAVSTIFGETFELDTHPPTISISSPSNGVTVATRRICIQGFAADAATNAPALDTNRWLQVTVNGDFVNGRTNGLWWAGPEDLVSGTNTFTAVATDQAGFSVSNSVWVIYDPTLATNVPVLTVDTTNTVVVGSNATTIAISGSIDSDNARILIYVLNATNNAITNAIVNVAVHGTNWWAEIPALSGSNVVVISAQNSGSPPVTNTLMAVQNPNVSLSIISPADGTDINSSNVLVVGMASTNFNGTITINGLIAATSTGAGGILFSNIVPISNMNANIIEVQATGTDGSTASVQEIVYGYEVLYFQETLNGVYNHLSSDCWYAQHFPSSYYYRDTQASILQWAAPELQSEQTESLWAYTLDGSTPPNCSDCDGTPDVNYYDWDATPYGIPMTGMGWVRAESYAEGVHLSDGSHGGDDQPFSFCLTNADCVCTNSGPYCIGVDTSSCCVPEAHRDTLENDQWNDTITFIKHWPTDEEQTVLLHFNEMSYWLAPTSWDGTDWTEASDPSKITYKGQTGLFYSLSPYGYTNIAFLVRIKTNTPYTIDKSDFTCPTTSASYTHTEANGTSSVTYNTVYSRQMLYFDGIGNQQLQILGPTNLYVFCNTEGLDMSAVFSVNVSTSLIDSIAWSIPTGDDKVQITNTVGNTATITPTDAVHASTSTNDVTIRADVAFPNGHVATLTKQLTVRKPWTLAQPSIIISNHPPPLDAVYADAYYRVLDQFCAPFPANHISGTAVTESFPVPAPGWQPAWNGAVLTDGTVHDTIAVPSSIGGGAVSYTQVITVDCVTITNSIATGPGTVTIDRSGGYSCPP